MEPFTRLPGLITTSGAAKHFPIKRWAEGNTKCPLSRGGLLGQTAQLLGVMDHVPE